MSPSSRPENSNSPERASEESLGPGYWIIALLVLVLLILHQDNWFWTDSRLVFGFMPIGLLWHAGISVGASLTWLLATKISWPVEPEFEAKVADAGSDALDQERVK